MKNQLTMLELFPEVFSGSDYEKSEEEDMTRIEKVMDAIVYYFEKHGYAPSVREIGEMAGLKSTSSVAYYMERLFDCGFLETDADDLKGCPRAFRVAGYKVVKEK